MLQDFLQGYLRQRPLFLSLIRAKEAELYQKFLPLKKPILDVGCGDGFFASVALAKKLKMKNEKLKIDVGLDLRDSRIEQARQLNIYKKLVIYDGVKIPLPNDSFQTVISNCVLEHVLDLDALLKEIRRVLKRDGVFLATVMAKPWEDNMFGTKLFGKLYKDWMRRIQIHRNVLTMEQWNNEFEKAGFRIQKTIGYLNPQACQLIDICHYLSFPSLISYKLTGKWVLLLELTKIYPVKFLSSILSKSAKPEQSGAIFYLLRK